MRHATTHSATMVCSGCGTEKPAADFRLWRTGGRLSGRCWVCRWAAARTARERRAALPPACCVLCLAPQGAQVL
ncbi:MAG: hypothetical protein FJ290_32445 [Planctomycetes bacterium]|nr:hypothetical protein [Planctomycetota bacterium]